MTPVFDFLTILVLVRDDCLTSYFPTIKFNLTGTRGATSAEYFLKAGYAVIFMHRQFSLQPFSRHYSHSTNPFLDFLEIEADDVSSGSSPQISVTPEKRTDLLKVLRAYKAVHTSGTLLTLTFVTVNDYLWLLRAVSQELSILGRKALYYLAAAVSDFFLPRQKMVNTPYNGWKNHIFIPSLQVCTQNPIGQRKLVH